MDLSDSLRDLAADASAAKFGVATRCAAANFRWEPAVGSERVTRYCDHLGALSEHDEWRAEHKGYLSAFVHVPKDSPTCAESFLPVSAQSHLREDLDNTFLLRLESLGHLFQMPLMTDLVTTFWQRFYNSQKDLRKAKLSMSDEALRGEFVSKWNSQRTQARPLFATFLNDFGGDLGALARRDWPHLLRDRLGLTHWPSTPGRPLPVALMCYSLDEVRRQRSAGVPNGSVAAFVRPTVLDAEMSAAFCPGPLLPGGESFGYTLDLSSSNGPHTLTPELLSFHIEYRPQHVCALGFITKPHLLHDDESVLAARNRHVQGLQRLPGCSNFGEFLT